MPAGAVGWEGGKTLIAAIDLIKKWRDPGTPNGWLQELSEYTTGDGKPELIWHYGGPELLHDLVLNQDALEAEKIIRSVIGLRDPELNMEVISISGYTWNDTPAFVLLREWVAPDPSPGNPISNTSGLLSKALLSFKPKPNSSAEPHAEKGIVLFALSFDVND
ncbi:hypothetical protein FRC10_002051 [Ceratobasidium sp. 414]|nr:hypothetical protein FRC10_002051 [Ceratobasidium sp. 414]